MEWCGNPAFLCRHLHLSAENLMLHCFSALLLTAPQLAAGGGLSSGEHGRHHHSTSAAGKHVASCLVTVIVFVAGL